MIARGPGNPLDTEARAAAPSTVVREPALPGADLPRLGPIVIGDPRIADPCSLVDTAALANFGDAQIDIAWGPFSTCWVNLPGDLRVELSFFDALNPGDVLSGHLEQLGQVTIARRTQDDTSCSRGLVLTDRSRVWITAEQYRRTSSVDLCAVAESATRAAVHKLATTGIGTRVPIDLTSPLARVDACSLLQPADLAVLPNLDALTPDPDFGGWRCEWGDFRTEGASGVLITYYRRASFSAFDGTPVRVGDRDAYLTMLNGRCVVFIPQRQFSSVTGQLRQETVQLEVGGPLSGLCTHATTLAEAVVPRLPPPSGA